MSVIRIEREICGEKLILETGRLAKQADGAVYVQYGDTIVLSSVCFARKSRPDVDFFPLTCEFLEQRYAAGKIPGGFHKREAKPPVKAILNARAIDRPLRPLFKKEFRNETQVINLVVSYDQENNPDILGVLGSSLAVSISEIPFDGPCSAIKMGRINGKIIPFLKDSQIEESDYEVLLAGTKESICMVEAFSSVVSEEDMLEAIAAGHEIIKTLCSIQEEIIAQINPVKLVLESVELEEKYCQALENDYLGKISEICKIAEKAERNQSYDDVVTSVMEKYATEIEESQGGLDKLLKEYIHDMMKRVVRRRVAEENIRLDNRNSKQIRPITCERKILPRAHGSALFTRGQTQSLGAVTLGTSDDEQMIDGLADTYKKKFTLHYNFWPFSTGEVKRVAFTSRRELGHGNLAEMALKPILPKEDDFPYTVRIVSEVLESNGSSSMATICSGSMGMMDAGVPIKAPVAGIAMGLIKEEDKIVILSDILGDEDHLGDMDFKVAGTREGITALQMDIKIKGVTAAIMTEALAQAREGRLHILGEMEKCITTHSEEISPYAPRIISIQVPVEKIGEVIGPGGKRIRGIVEETGVKIDIDDDGTCRIYSVDGESAQRACEIVRNLIRVPQAGEVFEGIVKRIIPAGAFVEFLPNRDGMVHISQIAHKRVNQVEDEINVGDTVKVKLLEVDSQGRYNLSMKALIPYDGPAQDANEGNRPPRTERNDRPRGRDDNNRRDNNDRNRSRQRDDRPKENRDDRPKEERSRFTERLK